MDQDPWRCGKCEGKKVRVVSSCRRVDEVRVRWKECRRCWTTRESRRKGRAKTDDQCETARECDGSHSLATYENGSKRRCQGPQSALSGVKGGQVAFTAPVTKNNRWTVDRFCLACDVSLPEAGTSVGEGFSHRPRFLLDSLIAAVRSTLLPVTTTDSTLCSTIRSALYSTIRSVVYSTIRSTLRSSPLLVHDFSLPFSGRSVAVQSTIQLPLTFGDYHPVYGFNPAPSLVTHQPSVLAFVLRR